MFSLFNFSSIFQGSADPICPYVRTPKSVSDYHHIDRNRRSRRGIAGILKHHMIFAVCLFPHYRHYIGWRRGVVVSGVRRMNEVNARRARLVLGSVTVFGRVYHIGM